MFELDTGLLSVRNTEVASVKEPAGQNGKNKETQMKSRLRRTKYPMPLFVKTSLEENDLMNAYQKRPAYQQNDYIGWINRAKRDETKQKRLQQMLRELADGNKYMNMEYRVKL